MTLTETLKQLSSARGPAGAEDEVRTLTAALLKPLVDRVYTDTLGSVIGVRKCAKSGAPRVLVETHMDEVGFIVTGTRDGMLTLAKLGGTDQRLLPGARLRVLSGPERLGIVCAMPPHVLSAGKMDKSVPLEDLYLDVGLSGEEAEKIAPGTPVVYDCSPAAMGDGVFVGKAMDNRASLAAVLMALEQLGDEPIGVELYVLASAQEELGCRGAGAGAFAVDPDYCICLDTTSAETPDTGKIQVTQLGGGPAISVGPPVNRGMGERMKKLAEEGGIPHQVEVLTGRSGTDADVIQISREGVATALISLPLKYMHSPCEMVSLADIEAAADLLAATLRDMGKGGRYA